MNSHNSTSPARDIFKGAIIGAAVATTLALLSNKDTRNKIVKGVKDTMSHMQKRTDEMGREAKEKYEKTIRHGEESDANR